MTRLKRPSRGWISHMRALLLHHDVDPPANSQRDLRIRRCSRARSFAQWRRRLARTRDFCYLVVATYGNHRSRAGVGSTRWALLQGSYQWYLPDAGARAVGTSPQTKPIGIVALEGCRC